MRVERPCLDRRLGLGRGVMGLLMVVAALHLVLARWLGLGENLLLACFNTTVALL